jgi:cytochrome c-type biogenesis protein CcmH
MSSTMTPRPRLAALLGVTAVATVAALALALLTTEPAAAQAPPATEAQAQSIERQLMCPQCPNERLDTCDRPVCRDMKRIIREQLADGRTPDDIILFFESRYGPRVRADLPFEGFNRLLYGWIGVSLLAVVGGATWYLRSLRRGARPLAVAAGATPDDRWLDEQLSDGSPSARDR